MKQEYFSLNKKELNKLLKDFPKDGKNSDIGKIAIEVVKLYFKSKDPNVKIEKGKNGADITVISNGKKKNYEVKGTQDSTIAYSKLKISSQQCHNALVNGMEIIRVTKIRQLKMDLYFLKNEIDFTLENEDRWKVKKFKVKDK